MHEQIKEKDRLTATGVNHTYPPIHTHKETHRNNQWTETMGAEASGSVALPSLALFPETANREDPQAMGAGAPWTLPALAEHGDGQNAHTVGRGPT